MSKCLKRIQTVHQLPSLCRVFIGLWPEDSLQPTLLNHARLVQQQCGGRIMNDHHWHITLAYLGSCNHVEIGQIIQTLQEVELSLMPVWLSQYGTFNKANVVWLGPEADQTIPAVLRLHGAHHALWEQLRFLNRRPEREYVPHVSLLRDAQAEALSLQLDTPVLWRHQACYVIASFPTKQANQYVVLHELKLG